MHESHPEIQLQDIAIQDADVSTAVDEPVRAMILDMLADEPMTAADVDEELTSRGFDRTENTIRHHINTLRDAGLVDVVRYEEGRGGTTKYYGATTMLLSYALPESAGDAVDELVEAARPEVEALLELLTEEHGDAIDEIVAEMEPCAHCRTQKYETYVLLTVLRRAFARAR
ncbi:helix-turn-helix domain-containing protein [Natrinema sp. 1APR25-10V2]|uniref:winged helix-turn-helix domain-containing protein n=1 Tax=Natrinema sp. 1APR25-10V2 TaxID=2951081 RepID=UPI002875B157|nr:helix-turn-helix domain-containing protein [Natrinema sp. 1APR25-10V2]MDS0477508.1 helix-turn-helix domain-containing protein [Natrinema sp. 1APR25-10V2]